MITYKTSRSRVLSTQRCPRSRWLLNDCQLGGASPEGGLGLIRAAIPLVTGSAVHLGLAHLLRGKKIEDAITLTRIYYEDSCKARKLEIDELANESYVYNEQLALIEGLLRLADARVIPALLDIYNVLEVETMDQAQMVATDDLEIIWRSIPDALLERKDDGDLYLLSWKTCASYGRSNEDDARVDMQGLSEAWAIHQRFLKWAELLMTDDADTSAVPQWFQNKLISVPYQLSVPMIRGIQMVYLVKGKRLNMGKDETLRMGISAQQYQDGARHKKTDSPLIYGYVNNGSYPPVYATTMNWHCSAPHPMRKGKWYPNGECPGDGRLHYRNENEWEGIPIWETIGVGDWFKVLTNDPFRPGHLGNVETDGKDPLDALWVMPTPYYRTKWHYDRWFRQTQELEENTVRGVQTVRFFEDLARNSQMDWEEYEKSLDIHFPQFTHSCRMWNRKCDAFEICFGPAEIEMDPLGSGLFQIKQQYSPVEKEVEVEE